MQHRIQRHLRTLVAGFVMGALLGCGAAGTTGSATGTSETGSDVSSNETPEKSLSDTSVSNAAASGMDTTNLAMALSITELMGSTDASENTAVSKKFGMGEQHQPDANVTVSYNCSDTEHTATTVRTYGAPTSADEGDGENVDANNSADQRARPHAGHHQGQQQDQQSSQQNHQEHSGPSNNSHDSASGNEQRNGPGNDSHNNTTENSQPEERGMSVSGAVYLSWSGMGTPACDNGSVQHPRFWVAVQGAPVDAAVRVMSTDPDHPTNPVAAIVRTNGHGGTLQEIGSQTTSFSDYALTGSTQSVNGVLDIPAMSRIRYQADGTTKIFDHTISTPTPLHFTLQASDRENGKPVRTVTSGELDVSHNLAQFTVHSIFDHVKWDYEACDCAPVAGTITLAVTSNDTKKTVGTGTITFTAATTGECGSSDVTYNGATIKLPTPERCQ